MQSSPALASVAAPISACDPPQFGLVSLLSVAIVLTSIPGLIGGLSQIDTGQLRQKIAAAPEVPPPPAPPFTGPAAAADRAQAATCLAQAIYYEAGFEPEAGQRAVAQVVLNRVRDRNFPNTVCGVVYQGAARHTGCQFSFACDGSLTRRPPKPEQLAAAKTLATQALDGYVAPQVGTATHYHTDYVTPWWKSTLVKVSQIGQHIFYRWPGHAGTPEALLDRYAGDEVNVWESFMKKPIHIHLHVRGRHGHMRRI